MLDNPIVAEIIAVSRAQEAARIDLARVAEIDAVRGEAHGGIRPALAAALVRIGLHIDDGAARHTLATAR